ncbi:MAG: hypothetical protein MUP22_07145 [Desulfobacterales bacterium]|nr:hypothetical protein [Desulfobacterales bacterium]
MKKIIIIVFLIVTAYFILHHQIEILKFGELEDEGIAYANQGSLPDIPEACSALAQDFERSCYRTKTGDVPYNQQLGAFRKIKSCLKKEGLSDEQIKEKLILIKQKANE